MKITSSFGRSWHSFYVDISAESYSIICHMWHSLEIRHNTPSCREGEWNCWRLLLNSATYMATHSWVESWSRGQRKDEVRGEWVQPLLVSIPTMLQHYLSLLLDIISNFSVLIVTLITLDDTTYESSELCETGGGQSNMQNYSNLIMILLTLKHHPHCGPYFYFTCDNIHVCLEANIMLSTTMCLAAEQKWEIKLEICKIN